MDSNNKSKLFWVGLFVSTGIIIFVLSILYLTDSSINTEYRFSVLFKNGMGVDSGSEVKMLGQKIGQVSKVEILDNRNGVVVELSIIDQLGIKIPNNSIFKIKTSLFGQTHVQIEPGNNSDNYIATNDVVQGAVDTETYDLDPVVKDLSAFSRQLSSIFTDKEVLAIQSIISNTDSLIDETKDSFAISNEINNIIENIKLFSEELNSFSSNLDSSLEPRLGQIDSILYEIENFTTDLEVVTGGFDSFASSANSLDSSMKVIQSLINEMNEGKGTLGKLLKDDSLYDNLNEVVDNTNSLINEVKNDPKSFFNININLGGK
tara:strand:- start:165 stop:1121 length:957 start_codon:yes stop_codon:yes gene_type:complete